MSLSCLISSKTSISPGVNLCHDLKDSFLFVPIYFSDLLSYLCSTLLYLHRPFCPSNAPSLFPCALLFSIVKAFPSKTFVNLAVHYSRLSSHITLSQRSSLTILQTEAAPNMHSCSVSYTVTQVTTGNVSFSVVSTRLQGS